MIGAPRPTFFPRNRPMKIAIEENTADWIIRISMAIGKGIGSSSVRKRPSDEA
jgi:hypothetical protein